MLRQADRGVRSECEARDRKAVDPRFRDFRRGDEFGDGAAKKPMCALDGIADIRDRHGRRQHDVVVWRRRRHQADPPR